LKALKSKKKKPSSVGGSHWLTIGGSALSAARIHGDSRSLYAADALEEFAAKHGKSVHTIRKIIDATAWVEDFYPELLASPPKRFPLTQALQMRAIYRLDPERAKNMAAAVFDGKLTGRELTEILDEVREGRYRPASEAVASSYKKAAVSPHQQKVPRTPDLESRVQTLLSPLLNERGLLPKMEVRSGSEIRPKCDFVISDSGTPKIAVEVKAFPSQPSMKRLLELLGSFLLWQSKGLSVWLFVPREASAGISELQGMISDGGLDPIEVFLVEQEGVTQHKASGQVL
jgi:hypothetical protein